MQGKYSPTVSRWYKDDQQWFEKNGGGIGNGISPDTELDNDGFDQYGYTDVIDGYDRAGTYEDDYLGEEGAELFEQVSQEWFFEPAPHLQKQEREH